MQRFTIELDRAIEAYPAAYDSDALREIERRTRFSLSAIVRHFSTVDASYIETVEILDVLLTTAAVADGKTPPSRAEIERCVDDRGIGDMVAQINPILTRVFRGNQPLTPVPGEEDETESRKAS